MVCVTNDVCTSRLNAFKTAVLTMVGAVNVPLRRLRLPSKLLLTSAYFMEKSVTYREHGLCADAPPSKLPPRAMVTVESNILKVKGKL